MHNCTWTIVDRQSSVVMRIFLFGGNTLITLGNNPVKGDLLDQDGDGLETPSIDQPAESMFNTFEVIFAGESLQIRSCD